jgi:DNA-binding transcriptional LysR family regulator
MLDDYNRVALFVRVVRTGSFTAAAAEAGIPKSSISRSVAQLEAELGVRLLQRTTRKLAPTAVGQAYYDAVASSVAIIDDAAADAGRHGTEPRGTVRITFPRDLGLARTLARFSRKHPAIRIESTVTNRAVDLLAEGFDLAVRAAQKLEDSSLVARRIGASEMIMLASPSYLRRRGRPKRVAELAQHDFVLYRATGGRAPLALDGPAGERATVEVTASLVFDDLEHCRTAIEEGAGIALLPVAIAAGSPERDKLVQVLPGWGVAGASIYVVMPSARYVPARVALLRDFLVDDLRRRVVELDARCSASREAAEKVAAAG